MSVVGRAWFRWALLGLVVVLGIALTTVFVLRAVDEQERKALPTPETARDRALDLGAVLDSPHVVFRSTAPGPTYGRLAAVPLKHPDGDRSVSTIACERVYATTRSGICLAAERGAITTYSAELLDDRMRQQAPVTINGIPSRTRLSADGTWAAVTTFVSGHAYTSVNFSTETTILERATGRSLGNLEKTFRTYVDGDLVTDSDLNIWGVTFAPGARSGLFYATVATKGRTWLAKGDLQARTLTSLRSDAECPSLSPDGTRVVYKKRAGSAITWRFHVLDLATGVERPLRETRSVDDQAEWLDDDHVLYGVPRETSGRTDVWVVDVRPGAGGPKRFIRDAWSPSVVRG